MHNSVIVQVLPICKPLNGRFLKIISYGQKYNFKNMPLYRLAKHGEFSLKPFSDLYLILFVT